MKERPIIFSGPMVRAILDGRKTQTRRVVKPQPDWIRPNVGMDGVAHGYCGSGPANGIRCPYGQPGDRLWVRETFIHEPAEYDLALSSKPYREASTVYRADVDRDEAWTKWTPSIYMPRWASRITLEVISVRVERLNEISESDAIAEGVISACKCKSGRKFWRDYRLSGDGTFCVGCPIASYRSIWQSINGPGSWAENPFVWVVEFRRV